MNTLTESTKITNRNVYRYLRLVAPDLQFDDLEMIYRRGGESGMDCALSRALSLRSGRRRHCTPSSQAGLRTVPVEPAPASRTGYTAALSTKRKGALEAHLFVWRRERDSNPR